MSQASFDYEEELQRVDGIVNQNTVSGNFNQLTDGTPLFYPYDLVSADGSAVSSNGIVNWLEFRTFARDNANLETFISRTGNAIGRVAFDAVALANLNEEGREEVRADAAAIFNENAEFGDENARDLNNGSVNSDTRISKAGDTPGDSIFLYTPGGIEIADNLQYEEVGFAAIKNLSNLSATTGTVALGALNKLASGVDAVAGVLGQESLNSSQFFNASLGVVINPRKEQVFQGVELRNFVFNFTFIPRSEGEAATVARIIKVFRFHAYPEVSANSAFFNFPSEFEIKYRVYDTTRGGSVKDNPILPRMNRCYLESVTTNYTPDDVYYAFRNGVPPKITMSLTFREAEYITRQHINEGF